MSSLTYRRTDALPTDAPTHRRTDAPTHRRTDAPATDAPTHRLLTHRRTGYRTPISEPRCH